MCLYGHLVIWVFSPFIYLSWCHVWRHKHIFCSVCDFSVDSAALWTVTLFNFLDFQVLSLVNSPDNYEGVSQDLTAQLILIKNKPKFFLMLEIHTESWDQGCGQFPSCDPLVQVQGSVQVVSCPRVICSGLFWFRSEICEIEESWLFDSLVFKSQSSQAFSKIYLNGKKDNKEWTTEKCLHSCYL